MKRLRQQKGIAFVYVLVFLFIMMIIVTTLFSLLGANVRQAKYQENRTKAYYVALSGVDLTLAALLEENALGYKLLDELQTANGFPTTTIDDIPEGDAVVTVTAATVDTEREVTVQSVGTHADSGATYTLRLKFSAANPGEQWWD